MMGNYKNQVSEWQTIFYRRLYQLTLEQKQQIFQIHDAKFTKNILQIFCHQQILNQSLKSKNQRFFRFLQVNGNDDQQKEQIEFCNKEIKYKLKDFTNEQNASRALINLICIGKTQLNSSELFDTVFIKSLLLQDIKVLISLISIISGQQALKFQYFFYFRPVIMEQTPEIPWYNPSSFQTISFYLIQEFEKQIWLYFLNYKQYTILNIENNLDLLENFWNQKNDENKINILYLSLINDCNKQLIKLFKEINIEIKEYFNEIENELKLQSQIEEYIDKYIKTKDQSIISKLYYFDFKQIQILDQEMFQKFLLNVQITQNLIYQYLISIQQDFQNEDFQKQDKIKKKKQKKTKKTTQNIQDNDKNKEQDLNQTIKIMTDETKEKQQSHNKNLKNQLIQQINNDFDEGFQLVQKKKQLKKVKNPNDENNQVNLSIKNLNNVKRNKENVISSRIIQINDKKKVQMHLNPQSKQFDFNWNSFDFKKNNNEGKQSQKSSVEIDITQFQNLFQIQLDNYYDNIKKLIQTKKEIFDKIFHRLEFITKFVYKDQNDVNLQIFGSHLNKLQLPQSDIDIQIRGIKFGLNMNVHNYFYPLIAMLENFSWISKSHYINGALIPVLKLEIDWTKDFNDIKPIYGNMLKHLINKDDWNIPKNISKFDYSIKIDIIIQNETSNMLKLDQEINKGQISTQFVIQAIEYYKPMEKLTIFFKDLLSKHQFNNSFKGGLSSYAISLLVLGYIQENYENRDCSTASIIIDFFYFYGYVFNPQKQIIRINPFLKKKYRFQVRQQSFWDYENLQGYLNIIEPITFSSGFVQNTYQFPEIQSLFKEISSMLHSNIQHYLKTASFNQDILQDILQIKF